MATTQPPTDAAGPDADDEVPFHQRVAENPQPALLWTAIVLVLFALEFGAFVSAILVIARGLLDILPNNPGVPTLTQWLATTHDIPTLLSREVVPNQGHWNGEQWVNTFMGLEPKHAWLLRVILVYAYAAAWLVVAWMGYVVYRDNYRYADWTPRDDVIRRMRSHSWGQFGFVVVFMFVVMAMFAAPLSPTTVEQNIRQPCGHETQYFNEESGQVESILVCNANINSASQGAGTDNVGPWTYDQYGRFHPFGTLPTPGKDLFTFMAAGARISLFIGVLAISIAGGIAALMALVTAYYKGLVDLVAVVASDSIISLPQLLLLILISVVFQNHWLGAVYNGGLLLALIFGFTSWPFLWRAIRGPAFQVSEQEWIDAAKSYGQRPLVTMRKHMLPYVLGYLLIYASLTLGGIIIATSALSFLGLGIQPPTPEWGRAVDMGQPYVATASWHISLIPGVLIVLVVTAFNALGDGIRDAIDPQSDVGEGGAEVAAAGGGGA